MGLTKCIGIISYFPDSEEVRAERIKRFENLIETLDEYFKLPIVIIAQNWKDYKIPPYCNSIYVYKYSSGLGITKARITLREKLLNFDYDYFIFLDDDSDVKCTQSGVDNYLKEIDSHPNMFGKFHKSWLRLTAISKTMLLKMNFDYIKNLEASRNEVWEDVAYLCVYSKLYPSKFFTFSKIEVSETSPCSVHDRYTTWYDKERNGSEKDLAKSTRKIIECWYKREKGKK